MNTAYQSADVLIRYHEAEEMFIALSCFVIAWRAHKTPDLFSDREKGERSRLFASGFLLLGISSLIHLLIHVLDLDTNLLYQSLIGYCFSLLVIIASLSAEKIAGKKYQYLPYGYLLLLIFLHPAVSRDFPVFLEFRPLAWISVSFLAGVVCVLYCTVFYIARQPRLLAVIAGFFLICLSSSFLFFPAAIGSPVWLAGHALRPFGFLLVCLGLTSGALQIPGGSILYRALTAFSLLAGLPLLIFGTLIFYENISPINILDQQWILFLLLGVTLATALFFGLGIIIRLIRPILVLKDRVEHIVDEGLQKRIELDHNDEIGELAESFNQMMARLYNAIDEQERMCRLAATGELAATLAHEIKNPLNAIGGAASYIGKNYEGELIQEFIKIITDEVKRINQLTLTLLNFAKPLVPSPMPTDVNELVQETLFLMEQEAKECEIALETKLARNLPKALCDRNQIRQILLNLLINAFEAAKENGRVSVETMQEKGWVHILVRDNGQGIAKEFIRDIFNPFFTTKTRGTGLGLAISKKIAREHGGDLKVDSSDNGSVFTIILQGVP